MAAVTIDDVLEWTGDNVSQFHVRVRRKRDKAVVREVDVGQAKQVRVSYLLEGVDYVAETVFEVAVRAHSVGKRIETDYSPNLEITLTDPTPTIPGTPTVKI